jgi:hypothetical protein
MFLSLLVIFICVCLGTSAAALGGYSLYLGFLAGWLCLPSVVAIVMLPCMVMDKIRAARRTPYPPQLTGDGREYRNESSFAC